MKNPPPDHPLSGDELVRARLIEYRHALATAIACRTRAAIAAEINGESAKPEIKRLLGVASGELAEAYIDANTCLGLLKGDSA